MLLRRILLLAVLLLSAGGLFAADEEPVVEEEKASDDPSGPSRPIYIPVKPAFVVNYGGPGRLKYMKLEVSLRAKDTRSSNAIRHHMPLIRDYLVRQFGALNDEDVDTQHGKEAVRLAALEGIKVLLKEEDGDEGVTGLYFNNFVIQR
jgi:flagellar protein FliL